MAEVPHIVHFDNAERGSIAIMATFSLMIVILITGIVYDFGLWFATKAELHHVADTAAMAGGRALGARHAGGRFYDGTAFQDPERKPFSVQLADLSPEESNWIKDAINDSGEENKAGGISISIPTADIEIGNWESDTSVFSLLGIPKNAVQVTVRRDGLTAMFGQLVGLSPYDLTATATAALTPLKYVPPATPSAEFPSGQIILPLGIDQSKLPEGNFCGVVLDLKGDAVQPECGAAWTTFTNSDLTTFDDMATALANGVPSTTPHTLAENMGTIGDPGTAETKYYFGGRWDTKKNKLHDIWERFDPDASPEPLDTQNAWETLLPVYQNTGTGCLSPADLTENPIPIVGFVSVFLDADHTDPHALITSQCGVVGVGRSGDVNDPNLDYGTFGSVPVLVQ